MEKPGLALLIGHALAKKGKAQHDPMPEGDDMPAEDGAEHEHLQSIAEDLLKAIDEKDASALADLLKEAFEACDMSQPQEGLHE